MPPLSGYTGSYDLFKRVSEDIITRVCTSVNGTTSTASATPTHPKTNAVVLPRVTFAHIRLGGIYSNDKTCIQVSISVH